MVRTSNLVCLIFSGAQLTMQYYACSIKKDTLWVLPVLRSCFGCLVAFDSPLLPSSPPSPFFSLAQCAVRGDSVLARKHGQVLNF